MIVNWVWPRAPPLDVLLSTAGDDGNSMLAGSTASTGTMLLESIFSPADCVTTITRPTSSVDNPYISTNSS